MERRLYSTGARLALVVSLWMMSAPTTKGSPRVSGAVGSGRDFLLTSVDYLGYHAAATGAECCQECFNQYPAVQIFTYDDKLGICSCMKTKPGAVPTTTESARSTAGMCVADGAWSDWSEFSECSATCGFATKTKKRTCTEPAPLIGGTECPGSNQQSVACPRMDCGTSQAGQGRAQRRRRAGRRGRGRRAGAASPRDDPKICLDLVPCVQCQQFNSGEYMDGVDDVDQDGVARCAKCQFKPVGVELTEAGWEGLGLGGTNLHVCTFLDDDMCRFSFVYGYLNGVLPNVWVQKNKAC